MDNTKKSSGSSRVGILDELRGFAIICMVVYHAMYDLKYLFGLDIPIFFDGWFDVIRDIFAGLFIFISGTVCRYSSNNIKRGAQCFFIGMIMTFVMPFFTSGTVMFGILHFLGVSMMLFGLGQKLFDLLPAAYTGAVEEIKKELNSLVGLGPVKEYVFGLADNLEVQQRRAAAGRKTASLSMHMIFTGNPGTGKTTIARLVAKYLKAIGALKGGQLVEVSRGDLVGRYTGHTAPLTNSVIESALGGVLFIDEAYSLYRGEQDSFGLEAIDTLVKGMEDHRDELVVILAGYTREMEHFLTANSGLASRFPNRIEFPDYTAAELLDITYRLAEGRGYQLDESCNAPLLGYYQRRQAQDARTAGNGRLARNTLEKAIFHQSRRLVAEPAAALDVILPGDLELE